MTTILNFSTGKARRKRKSETDQVDDMLLNARGKTTTAIILGLTPEGHLYVGSTLSHPMAFMILERFKHHVLTGDIERPDDD